MMTIKDGFMFGVGASFAWLVVSSVLRGVAQTAINRGWVSKPK